MSPQMVKHMIRWNKVTECYPKKLLPYRSFTCCIDLNVQQCWPNKLKPYVNTVGGKDPEQWKTKGYKIWQNCAKKKIKSRFILFILWIFCSGFPQGALCSDASHCVGMYLEEPLWRNNWCLHAPNFLGFVPGVWLVVKRHTRCLVIASTVAWRVVIKPKRTRCSPSKHCVVVFILWVQSVHQSHTAYCEKNWKWMFYSSNTFYGHYKQNSVWMRCLFPPCMLCWVVICLSTMHRNNLSILRAATGRAKRREHVWSGCFYNSAAQRM